MEVQAAVIQVGGAHHGCLVIAQAHFGVDEAGLIFVDLDAALDEGLVIGAADHVDIPFIRVGGGDDADIYTTFCRGFQGGDKFIIQDEVGCGDIDIMVRPLDEVQIGILRHIKVIQGGIGVGLHIALRRERPRGEVFFLGTIEGIAAGVQGPLLEEHTGKAAHRGATQQHGGILPVAETLHLIDVFIGQIDAAGEAYLAIDDTDLAVVAVIKAGIHAGAHGVIRNSLDIEAGQFLGIAGGKPLNAAEVIVDDADLHPGGGPLPQNFQDGIPHQAFFEDEILEEDEFLGLGQLPHQLAEEILAQRGVFHLGAAIDREAGDIADIIGEDAAVGGLLQQGGGVAFLSGKERRVGRFIGGDLLPVAVGQCFIAELEVEEPAHHRQRHDEDDPSDLVGGVIILGDQPDDNDKAEQHKGGVKIGGVAADIEQDNGEDADLDHDEQREPEYPADEEAQYFFHAAPPFPRNAE